MKKPRFSQKYFIFIGLFCAISALTLTRCIHTQHSGDNLERAPQSLDAISAATSVSIYFAPNMPSTVQSRITQLFKSNIPKMGNEKCNETEKHIDIYFGQNENSLITASEKNALKDDESFLIKTQLSSSQNCLNISVDGKSQVLNSFKSSRGLSFGSYAVLQDIGFRFLHPLKPESEALNLDLGRLAKISRTESPFWETRSIHLHTMHPLELTNVLNGWGVAGPNDKNGWEQLLPYWSLYLEWMLAHKQNEVEWMLLWSPEAQSFNQSAERQSRLQKITSIAKDWGVDVGIVTPVRFVQQNGWTLLRQHEARKNTPNEEQQNISEILGNINWLIKCGFTAISGELGEGEFSSAPAANTLQELNAIGTHLSQQNPPIPYRVKVHISQKQFAAGYKDPGTGQDINFNYLPLYANEHVGVMPHTVQIYSLNDPAPTYENENFMDMFRFLKMAAKGSVQNQKREVLFYPETAYWVSYDIDVPLFLPVYAYRRVQDLRMIAQDQLNGEMKRNQAKINGQVIFSSGWEWGYWFNDVITAEAAWNPHVNAANTSLAYQEIIRDVFRLDSNNALASTLASISENQHKLLVLGQFGHAPPSTIEKRSGIAYLSGLDSFDEIGMWTRENLPERFKNVVPLTQPNKFRDDWAFKLTRPFYLNEAKYKTEVKPLLQAMANILQKDADKIKSIAPQYSNKGLNFALQDFIDGSQINAHRANFVFNIYEARLAKSRILKDNNQIEAYYNQINSILNKSLAITASRKNLIPLQPAHRSLITAWESASYQNPTDYHFGYLWSAYNLFYWRREFNKLRYQNEDNNLCYMNIIKASELEGKPNSSLQQAEEWAQITGYFKSCATIPAAEPDLNRGW